MKALFITLFTAILIAFSIPTKAQSSCPTPINIRWVGPSCDSLTVSLVFTMPCNGKCSEGQTSYNCQTTIASTTLVTEASDGTLTIPCCAADIKVRVSGCGHSLQMPYERSRTGSTNGVVVLIDEDGNMRVNSKPSQNLASKSGM